ncbi:glycosyltransferase family 20-domain-containing protein [Phlyctochytrium arcticum]|nr:glycosyltransferase family 20-domain-containing protein [Phlyctochytrium arcticum]
MQPLFFMEDDQSDLDELSPTDGNLFPPVDMCTTQRTIIASLFLPYTVGVSSSPKKGDLKVQAPLERRRSVGAIEFKRQRKASESRGLRPEQCQWTVEPCGLGNIGLQNALKTMKRRMPDPLWVGTLGVSTQDWSDDMKQSTRSKLKNSYSSAPVFLTDEEVEGHYNQFCKQVLWKPFHYQLPDYPKGESHAPKAWKQYVAVNQKFAHRIAEEYQPNDVVWINDYHLMLVPALLRKLRPEATIGFFLHIPFPSSEIFRCLHVRKQILEGMLGADLIGFQTYPFMRHFLMTCTRLLALESTPKGVQLEDRTVSVMPIPIGINLDALNEKRLVPDVAEIVASLKEKYAGMKVLIGRDKNDYVKGVRQKFLAFERFLKDNPQWHGKVILIQVALSTTEANENECRVSDVVARINSRFGSIEYSPVLYLHQDISFSHYLALLTVADACLVTSLRDGMNLTSHEYVVCQTENHGPLIISEFAGTYGSFGAALRVNPWDVQEVATAINDALSMDPEEKTARWKELYSHVVGNTAQTYVETFTTELAKAHEDVSATVAAGIPPLPTDLIVQEYLQSRKRLFFLDQDGTIMNFNKHSSTKLLSSRIPSDTVVQLVKNLASDPRNIIYIMSGRCKADMSEFVGLPNVGLCAENGCFLKYVNRSKWETMLPDQNLSWRQRVLDILEYYTDRTPGAYIEQKEIGMVWHYGNADLSFASWQAAECRNHIEQSLTTSFAIHVLAKKRSIEIMPRNVNKGFVIRRVMDYHQGRVQVNRRVKRTVSVSENVLGEMEMGDSSLENCTPRSEPDEFVSSPSGRESEGGFENDASTYSRERVDFIFSAGDDRADEYMFEYLNRLELHMQRREVGDYPSAMNVMSPEAESSDAVASMANGNDAANGSALGSVSRSQKIEISRRPGGGSSSDKPVDRLQPSNNLHRNQSVVDDFDEDLGSFRSRASMPRSLAGHLSMDQNTPTMPSTLQNGGRRRPYVTTCTIGKKSSAAKWFLGGPQEVLDLVTRLIASRTREQGWRLTAPEKGFDLQSLQSV